MTVLNHLRSIDVAVSDKIAANLAKEEVTVASLRTLGHTELKELGFNMGARATILKSANPGLLARACACFSEDKSEPRDEFKLAKKYMRWIKGVKHIIIGIWLFLACAGAYPAIEFMSSTVTTFDPPPGSKAFNANQVLEEFFPGSGTASDMALLIEATDRTSSVLRDEIMQFTMALNESVFAYAKKHSDSYEIDFQSYYTLVRSNFPDSAAALLNAPKEPSAVKTATIISMSASCSYSSDEALDLADFVKAEVKRLRPKDDKEEMTMTGVATFLGPMISSAENDLGRVDAVVLPLAMLVLALIVKSMRLMLVAISCTACSACLSFAIMYLVTFLIEVNSVVPTLMMSILIAMNIDYSLFLMSRYREARECGESHEKATTTSMGSAGHTILVSGSTLIISFFGLLFFPLDLLISLGLGCALSMMCTLAISLTLTPSLLMTFPAFFAKALDPWCFGKCAKGNREPAGAAYSQDIGAAHSQDMGYLQEPLYGNQKKQKDDQPTCWYKFGDRILTMPYNIILIVLIVGFVVPFAIHANVITTDSMDLNLPRDLDQTAALGRLESLYGPGLLYPFRMLIVAPSGISADSKEFYQTAHDMIEGIPKYNGVTGLTTEDFTGLVYAEGKKVMQPVVQACVGIKQAGNVKVCRALQYAYDSYLNTPKTAQWVMVTPTVDPLDRGGSEWLQSFRAAIDNAEYDHPGYKIHLAGMAVDSMDAIDIMFDLFPNVIISTCAVVLVLMGFAFRSVLIPIRAVFTIGVTLSWVYGFASLTYTNGVLEWTHIPGFQPIGALIWMIPLITFSIIVGIGLDYDIFLLTRVREYWLEGYSPRDAILMGLDKTGHIITAAGVIMGIAFSGLLFSSMPAVNQLSFFLVFSVLLDTFVIRTILVPCIMVMFGENNFWPAKRPKGTVLKAIGHYGGRDSLTKPGEPAYVRPDEYKETDDDEESRFNQVRVQ